MSNAEIDIVSISVMGRDFKIKCPKDKVSELQEVANYLNGKMQEVQHGDKSITIDRVAITAALNIAHELIIEKQKSALQSDDDIDLSERFYGLKQKVNQALASLS